MKLKTTELARAATILSFCITTNLVAGQGNSASVGFVNQAIATATTAMETYVNNAITTATTLTQADWQGLC